MQRSCYIIVGELIDKLTRLSEVRLFDYNTLSTKCITKETLEDLIEKRG